MFQLMAFLSKHNGKTLGERAFARISEKVSVSYLASSLLFASMLLAQCFLSAPLHAADTTFYFDDPEQQKVFRELTAELRCPMCQNQNIADSNAMIALDLKRKTYDLVQQGQSKQEVIDYMKARYGDFVHYQPPVTPVTVWLWLFPVLFVAFAVGMLVRAKLGSAASTDTLAANATEEGAAQPEQASSQSTNSPSANSHLTKSKTEADVSRADALLDKYK